MLCTGAGPPPPSSEPEARSGRGKPRRMVIITRHRKSITDAPNTFAIVPIRPPLWTSLQSHAFSILVSYSRTAPRPAPPATIAQHQTAIPMLSNLRVLAAPVGLAAALSVPAALPVLEGAAELIADVGTELTASLPHSLQSAEPGVLMLH